MPEETEKKKPPFSLQNLMKTRRHLVLSIGMMGICVILSFSFIFPKVQSARTQYSTLKRENRKLDQLEKKLNILTNVESVEVYANRDRIHAILPSTKPVLLILQKIERLSGETGVIVSEFGVSPGQISTSSAEQIQRASRESESTTDVIETQLTLVGRIDNINQFLGGINSITPITQTSELTIKATNRSGALAGVPAQDEGVFEAGVVLTSYFYAGHPESSLTQDLPDIQTLTDEIIDELAVFQFVEGAEQFLPTQVEGGGKEDLFQ